MSAKPVNGFERGADEVLMLATEWTGDRDKAETWFRTAPISAFGGRTPRQMVFRGNEAAVKAYIAHLTSGGYA